ncbi:hypothetical protein A4A49_14456 [Nicotiana attenuata]|uniref:Uncharacterized protein n=1 Tax=Nicotiana attenuata TaxID=49451 RepID=A0A314L1M5_NICAT|nr:hypothetical protein A4A49_14456 [Nicotiana attenuata]
MSFKDLDEAKRIVGFSAIANKKGLKVFKSDTGRLVINVMLVVLLAMTRLQQRKLHQEPIGTRKIAFKGDIDGVNVPTDLPYSPKKLTWKGKSAISSSQLVAEKEKKNWKTED